MLNVLKAVKKSLKHKYKEQGIKFDYVLSIDVQTTCWPGKTKKKPELIELVVVATHIKENSVKERYHTFVRPTENPELSEYCVTNTGITQEDVDKSKGLEATLAYFCREFMDVRLKNVHHGLGLEIHRRCPGMLHRTQAINAGWHGLMERMVYVRDEINRKGLMFHIYEIPIFDWINFFEIYLKTTDHDEDDLKLAMANMDDLEYVTDEENSRFDVATNIGRLATRLIRDGCKLPKLAEYNNSDSFLDGDLGDSF